MTRMHPPQLQLKKLFINPLPLAPLKSVIPLPPLPLPVLGAHVHYQRHRDGDEPEAAGEVDGVAGGVPSSVSLLPSRKQHEGQGVEQGW